MISGWLIRCGSTVQHSEFGHAGVQTVKITTNYESTLNLARAYKSFADFAIKAPTYLNPFLESLGRNFQYYVADFNIPVSKEIIPSFDGLKPLAKCLGAVKDAYTFLELPLRIAKLCDPKVWDPEKAKKPAAEVYTKLVSMVIQIPQKMVESLLLIPNTYGVIDLAKHCTRFGTLTSTTFATTNFVVGIKEVCVLSAAIFSAISYTLEINRHTDVLKRKEVRKVQLNEVVGWNKDKKSVEFKKGKDINAFAPSFFSNDYVKKRHEGKRLSLDELKDRIALAEKVLKDAENAKDKAQKDLKNEEDALAPYATSWNPIRFFSRQPNVNNAKIALDDIEANIKTRKAEYEAACNRYVRRFAAEENDCSAIGAVPEEVKIAIRNVFANLTTQKERLEKVFTYKFLKNDAQLFNAKMGITKGTYARRFDWAKALIVSISLMTITGAVAIPALAPVAAGVGVATWIAVGIIGYAGYRRTTFLAYEYKEKALPTSKDIFEKTSKREDQKTFV